MSIANRAQAHLERHTRFHEKFEPPLYICNYGGKNLHSTDTYDLKKQIESVMWKEKQARKH